jgi:ribosomal protein S18 acetylase RimI-like enzyme
MADAGGIRMSTSLRNASVDDADAIDTIFRTSFCDTFAHLYRREDLEAFLSQFTRAAWEAELHDREFAFRLAEVDGKVAAYVKLGPLKVPVRPEGRGIELKQLYVASEHHGTGIARALMDWAIDEARRRRGDELYLTVYVDNYRAKRFYDRYGFEAVGRYDFMVGSQADEDIIMRKRL